MAVSAVPLSDDCQNQVDGMSPTRRMKIARRGSGSQESNVRDRARWRGGSTTPDEEGWYRPVHSDRRRGVMMQAGMNIPPHYSVRRLATGSVRIARTAAGNVASNVAGMSTSQGTAIICGSVGLTS